MSKKVLVIYYSQSGQLGDIINNFTQPLSEAGHIVEKVCVQPEKPYPFPWTGKSFFAVMPDCVLQVPTNLQPFQLKDLKLGVKRGSFVGIVGRVGSGKVSRGHYRYSNVLIEPTIKSSILQALIGLTPRPPTRRQHVPSRWQCESSTLWFLSYYLCSVDRSCICSCMASR